MYCCSVIHITRIPTSPWHTHTHTHTHTPSCCSLLFSLPVERFSYSLMSWETFWPERAWSELVVGIMLAVVRVTLQSSCWRRGHGEDPERMLYMPWLVQLSGLSAGLRTKRVLVWFPVRAHAWVAGQVPSWGCARGNHTLMFLSHIWYIDVSIPFFLPSPLSRNEQIKSLKK